MRKELGITITAVFHAAEDEDHVTVISEVLSSENAKAILSSSELNKVAKRTGVISTPEAKI